MAKTVNITFKGGLGNQMFQFAAGYAMSREFKSELIFDTSFLESNVEETETFTPRKFELGVFPLTSQFGIVKNSSVCKREINNLNFNSNFLFERLLGYEFYLNDYFQCESYFLNYKDEIKKIFTFDTTKLTENVHQNLKEIRSQKLISIHFRRGDYLKAGVKEVHGICGIDYYLRAIETCKQKFNNPKFILFSDDPELAEFELKPYLSEFYTVKNTESINSWMEMYLMSQCFGNIIANSTFSWWGAYLNNHKNVIAPKNWFLDPNLNFEFRNVIPKSWISI